MKQRRRYRLQERDCSSLSDHNVRQGRPLKRVVAQQLARELPIRENSVLGIGDSERSKNGASRRRFLNGRRCGPVELFLDLLIGGPREKTNDPEMSHIDLGVIIRPGACCFIPLGILFPPHHPDNESASKEKDHRDAQGHSTENTLEVPFRGRVTSFYWHVDRLCYTSRRSRATLVPQ